MKTTVIDNNKLTIKEKLGEAIFDVKDTSFKGVLRITGRQVVKNIKGPLITFLKSKGTDNATLQLISEFLDTPVGTGVISGILGMLLPQIPVLNKDVRVQMLAEEFKVEGFSVIGGSLVDDLISYAIPAVTGAVSLALKDFPEMIVEKK